MNTSIVVTSFSQEKQILPYGRWADLADRLSLLGQAVVVEIEKFLVVECQCPTSNALCLLDLKESLNEKFKIIFLQES